MTEPKKVVVVVTDAALKDVKNVAETLAVGGMTINHVLPMTGVITGSCAEENKATLRAMPGVQSLEDDMTSTTCAE